MRNKDVLVILTPGFAASESDSTCLPMQQDFVRTLQKTYPFLDVVILSFQYPYHQNPYEWRGRTIIPFDGRNKGGIRRLWLRRKVLKVLKQIHHTQKIVGLLSFWYGECAFVGKLFEDQYHVKHFCWILGQDARKQNSYPARVRLKSADLIALSDFLQDEFHKNHQIKPLVVVPPGIPPYLKAASERSIDLLAAGSLLPLKQFHIYIKILAEIKRRIPNVRAMLIGKGPEMDRLRALAISLGVENNIVFTGEIHHDEVLNKMHLSKVFLHPSSYEGFSGVCLEALAAGARVVSFCKPMHRDIENWHIATSEEDMKNISFQILQGNFTSRGVTPPFTMEETVRKMMALYGC